MTRLHSITHDNTLIKSKVNFFADYFAFAAETIGVADSIKIENTLSIVDKMLFQISQNLEHCTKYLDSYLTNDEIQIGYHYLKDDKIFKRVHVFLAHYKSYKKHSEKLKYIESTPEFIKALKTLRTSLHRTMFKKSLNAIISYLKCSHRLDHHQTDFVSLTNLLVSEFVLNDRSRNDRRKVFQRILSKEIDEFPFPKSLNTKEEKESYLKNRTFQQQFDGIYNLLKEPLIKNYFLFRVYGVKTPNDFTFTYNKVTFCNPASLKLHSIVTDVRNNKLIDDFLNQDDLLLVAIKAEYNSIDIAVAEAVETIGKELRFFNKVNKTNCVLEQYSYLLTVNFKNYGWHIDPNSLKARIESNDLIYLKDNPYTFLKNCSRALKEPFLKARKSLY